MNIPTQLYKESLGLLTDMYQISMAQSYWKNKRHETNAVFNLFFRKLPFGGKYAICAGLEYVLDYLENFHFSKQDTDYLAGLTGRDNQPLFESDFLQYLKQLRFTGSVRAIPEGSVVFPGEPLIQITAPIIQGQLVETALLNIINFQTLIATKAARICQAARYNKVVEFGLRRAQGIDGGISASRAAFIGGCVATSNVLAGKLFGIPVVGTHAHSWVMSFDSELEAFEAYAQASPNNCTLLVDTYDTITGVKNAITVGLKLREQGHDLAGIRLDSGDLARLSIIAREMLDAAGFKETSIVASNDLDEYKITELKSNGAMIDTWGVGTNLVTGDPAGALGGVYKLGSLDGKPKIKLSEDLGKTTNPGVLRVIRFSQNDKYVIDMITDIDWDKNNTKLIHPIMGLIDINRWQYKSSQLDVPAMEDGKRITSESITVARDRCIYDLAHLPDTKYKVGLDEHLLLLKKKMMAEYGK